jgi:hypothetical protein
MDRELNVKRNVLSKFFKWLYYPNIDSSKKRSELSAQERKPECIWVSRS